MSKISDKQRALNKLKGSDESIRYYFDLLEELLEGISSAEPALSHCFQRIESAQRVSLYVLLMRKYRTDSQVAWSVVDSLDITRKSFPEHYANLTGRKLGTDVTGLLKEAIDVRDRITHGKHAKQSEILQAITACLVYAETLNQKVRDDAGFAPFGPLRGVTSSRRPQLEKDISRLVIKGLGLANA